MYTQEKHTPTPWNTDGLAIVGQSPEMEVAVCTTDRDIPRTEADANAEFIVKACNSYDKMRELLSAAYQKLYIADRIIDPYTEEDGEDIAGQLFSEGLADEIDTFLQNT